MKTKDILHNITQRTGIVHLNAMQQQMASTEASDILLVAPTGSGKTIAFAIRLLRAIDYSMAHTEVQAMVIAPSRELVIQIAEVLRRIATGLKVTPMYGGHSFEDEVNSLSVTPDIVVATPGRLLDHLNRRTIYLGGVSVVVLDEYDKSLELGFSDEMCRILRHIPRPHCRILTSATILDDIPQYATGGKEFELFDYTSSSGAPAQHTPIVEVPSHIPDKLDTLSSLLASIPEGKTIVFVNHRESAQRVFDRLRADGYPVGIYHGQLDQNDRRHAIQLLANGSTPILVATDLAARGLDIPQVEAVVHYHLPREQSVWTHRNGRTARQGTPGTVYTIVSDGETIPQFIGFDRSFTPKGTPDNTPAKANANGDKTSSATVGAHGSFARQASTVTLRFGAGKKEKISRGDILGFLTQAGDIPGNEVGIITVDDHESTAAIPANRLPGLIMRLRAQKLKGHRVLISLLSPSASSPHKTSKC